MSRNSFVVNTVTFRYGMRLSLLPSIYQAEWMWILSQTISLWLSSYKSDSTELPSVNHRSAILRTTPANRVASHMFYKSGHLQGAVYKGQWRMGQLHGEGQLSWADGRVYSGQFVDGELTG